MHLKHICGVDAALARHWSTLLAGHFRVQLAQSLALASRNLSELVDGDGQQVVHQKNLVLHYKVGLKMAFLKRAVLFKLLSNLHPRPCRWAVSTNAGQ